MNFNIYSKYYDLLYKDKNYQQEAEYVFDSLSSFYPPNLVHARYMMFLSLAVAAEIMQYG